MATNTPRLNLALPDSGTTRWDLPINNNFTIIDQAISGIELTPGPVGPIGPVGATGPGSKRVFTVGDGASSNFRITHEFNSCDLVVSVRLTDAPYSKVGIRTEFIDANTISLTSDTALPISTDYLTVIVIG